VQMFWQLARLVVPRQTRMTPGRHREPPSDAPIKVLTIISEKKKKKKKESASYRRESDVYVQALSVPRSAGMD